MSTASEEQRSLDLLKAAQLMLKHGISPEGELQAALTSQPSLPEERSACPRGSSLERSPESSDASE